MAMIRTTAAGLVPAPPSAVYAFLAGSPQLTEPARHPVEVVCEEEPPKLPRTARLRTYLPNGATVDSWHTLLDCVEDERVVSRTSVTPFGFRPFNRTRFPRLEIQRTVTLEPKPGGTSVTMETELRFRPAPLGLLYAALAKRDCWQRSSEEAIQRLSDHLLRQG